MCGRYELHTRTSEIARRFDAQLIGSMQESAPRYNVAPSTAVPVVRAARHGRVLEPMSWGLVPSWCKDLSGQKPINARVETVFDKPMFRSGIRRRRCLIPRPAGKCRSNASNCCRAPASRSTRFRRTHVLTAAVSTI